MDEPSSQSNLPSSNLKTILEQAVILPEDSQLSSSHEQEGLDSLLGEDASHAPTQIQPYNPAGSARNVDQEDCESDEFPNSHQKPAKPADKKQVSLSIGNKVFKPFNDRYWIAEQLGTGGMGVVHLGWDINLQRHVAIKLIRKDTKVNKKQYFHRFLREARIASRLRHPGILGIHDFSVESSGTGYIIMDLITGKTMEQAILEAQADEPKRQSLLNTFLQICQAISFAHANGIVHRDLKPANIMVGDYGLATVLDWGLAKVVGATPDHNDEPQADVRPARTNPTAMVLNARHHETFNTMVGTVMGTPHYLAPEQARGESVDFRADVFSLGGILCHLLTGNPPFFGKMLKDVYQQSASGDVTRALDQLDRCGAPIAIVQLAKRCLEPKPDNRPRDASFLVSVLKEYLESGQRRAEEELVRFFDLSLDLFCIANTQGYFWKLNSNFTRTLGYTAQELTSIPFIEFVHPDDRPDTLNEIAKLSRGEPTIQFKNRYCKKDGQYIWLEWTARSLTHEGVIYAVARDITDRIQLENEKNRIESAHFRLSEIVQSATDAIIGIDLDGIIQSWNLGAETLLGYTANEICGKKIHELIPSDRIEEESVILERIRNGERVDHFETVRIHKNGQRIEVSLSVSPVRDRSGLIIGASKISRCLSKQRVLESELARSRSALVEVAENANIPMHCVDQRGDILWANNAELNFLGYSHQEYIGQPIAKFHADQHAISNIFNLLMQGKSLTHYVAKLIAKDGSIKDVAIYSSAFRENNELVHTRCFTIDLNQMKSNGKNL
jgi:PAS domain S-box-containing protein